MNIDSTQSCQTEEGAQWSLVFVFCVCVWETLWLFSVICPATIVHSSSIGLSLFLHQSFFSCLLWTSVISQCLCLCACVCVCVCARNGPRVHCYIPRAVCFVFVFHSVFPCLLFSFVLPFLLFICSCWLWTSCAMCVYLNPWSPHLRCFSCGFCSYSCRTPACMIRSIGT